MKFVIIGCARTIAPLSAPRIFSSESDDSPAMRIGVPTISPFVGADHASGYPIIGAKRGDVISSVYFSSSHPRPNGHDSMWTLASPHDER